LTHEIEILARTLVLLVRVVYAERLEFVLHAQIDNFLLAIAGKFLRLAGVVAAENVLAVVLDCRVSCRYQRFLLIDLKFIRNIQELKFCGLTSSP
jgi:hypothetical protein